MCSNFRDIGTTRKRGERMTLEEAIKHAEEMEGLLIGGANSCDLDDRVEKIIARNNAKCAEEHRQLAEWLKELQERRKQIKSCEGCKWLRLHNGCANDRCARMYKDRYEAERRTDD